MRNGRSGRCGCGCSCQRLFFLVMRLVFSCAGVLRYMIVQQIGIVICDAEEVLETLLLLALVLHHHVERRAPFLFVKQFREVLTEC